MQFLQASITFPSDPRRLKPKKSKLSRFPSDRVPVVTTRARRFFKEKEGVWPYAAGLMAIDSILGNAFGDWRLEVQNKPASAKG